MVVAAGVADPVHHAAQTAGTPVIMLNGSNDGVVTPESGKALYAALGRTERNPLVSRGPSGPRA